MLARQKKTNAKSQNSPAESDNEEVPSQPRFTRKRSKDLTDKSRKSDDETENEKEKKREKNLENGSDSEDQHKPEKEDSEVCGVGNLQMEQKLSKILKFNGPSVSPLTSPKRPENPNSGSKRKQVEYTNSTKEELIKYVFIFHF
jgi:hypothetical protein